MTTRCAIWARVSTTDQHAGNQLGELRAWAARRGLDVAREYVTEDSAWQQAGNGKGADFDARRAELIDGARLGHYQVVLIWALDRLSRRGTEDILATLRRLAEHDCDVWSRQEDWLRTSSPEMRELLTGIFGWLARQESARRSERTRAGMARAAAQGKQIGGRKAGARDRRPRATGGYSAAWTPERRAALADRNRQRATQPGE